MVGRFFAGILLLNILVPSILLSTALGQVVSPSIDRPPANPVGPVQSNPNVAPQKNIFPRGFDRVDSSKRQLSGSTQQRNDGMGTFVPVPSELQELLEGGGIPTSLQQLRRLENQQRAVGRKAEKCTVSVSIGAAQGCGVIITDTGYIVTAAHVATRPGKRAWVMLSNGRKVSATTLGMNRSVDAGLIKIDPEQNGNKPWPHATLGTSKDLTPGMWCIAMGHPGGYDRIRGPVIRVGRLLDVRQNVMVSDCALIGGDSGGPLFNIAGELIAVHSRIGNDVADNLHVPIDHYGDAWDDMAAGKRWGELPGFKPTLGVTGDKSDKEAIIIAVKKGSAAEKGGLQANDVITQFGEKKVTNFESLKEAVSDTMPGERVVVWFRRANRPGPIRAVIEIGRS